MAVLYELGVLGAPSSDQIEELREIISHSVARFNLRLGKQVSWTVHPDPFCPSQRNAAAAVYFGAADAPNANIATLLGSSVPVLPVVSSHSLVNEQIPEILRPLNCLSVDSGGMTRVATALLECAGLLPRQRRVFVSYRRSEAREAALQLFDAFSSRLFDVFLDTHGIAPAADFQTILWHRLCDSDVLVMLDTPTYFESRWTSAEFGRALAKGISVLRVGWPDSTPSARTATASRAELLPEEVDAASGRLAQSAIDRICVQLETVRSESHAVRNLNLYSELRIAVQRIGGKITGVGLNRAIHIELSDRRRLVVYPTVGVPTSMALYDATQYSPHQTAAVVYDHIGLNPVWLEHLDWLGTHVRAARWIKAAEAAWQFADWEA